MNIGLEQQQAITEVWRITGSKSLSMRQQEASDQTKYDTKTWVQFGLIIYLGFHKDQTRFLSY